MSELSSLNYENIDLTEVAFIDDIPHVTRKAIGEWLEYTDPQKAIDNLIDRNPHLEA